ncbi:MAG: methionine ABC transporter ATP-binding protein [Tissierellia bacterium]|nr:methionine ABC transporter ATP-binding protein [Tissierellia bacterium]
MIEIRNLSKSFGNLHVLDDISLDIKRGDIHGLIGRSGAGKSTLLRCINRLEDFQQGSLKVDGVDIGHLDSHELREVRKNIGMIFQHFSLMQRKTVFENIALPMECWGYDQQTIDKKVKDLAEVVDITEKLQSKPRELSGGQKQRVAIARALSLDSNVLLSDEATSALDPKTTESILDLLKQINKTMGITIVVVAHQMEVIKRLCDNVTVLNHGKIEIEGPVSEVFLHNPNKLNRILGGGQDIVLPETGVNIRIVSAEKDRSKKILSSMARALDINFAVPWSNIETFKDSRYAVINVNVDDEDASRVKEYLNHVDILWREAGDE